MAKKSDTCSPRELHLDFILQFTSDIRQIPGKDNTASDALSRVCINSFHLHETIDYEQIGTAQKNYTELFSLLNDKTTILQIIDASLRNSKTTIKCIHFLSHPGIKAFQKMITSKFIWKILETILKAGPYHVNQNQNCKTYACSLRIFSFTTS